MKDKAVKGDWLVYSEIATDPPFRTFLADCTREHAESVQAALVYEFAWPDDVFLVPIVSVANPEPTGNPVPFKPKENTVNG